MYARKEILNKKEETDGLPIQSSSKKPHNLVDNEQTSFLQGQEESDPISGGTIYIYSSTETKRMEEALGNTTGIERANIAVSMVASINRRGFKDAGGIDSSGKKKQGSPDASKRMSISMGGDGIHVISFTPNPKMPVGVFEIKGFELVGVNYQPKGLGLINTNPMVEENEELETEDIYDTIKGYYDQIFPDRFYKDMQGVAFSDIEHGISGGIGAAGGGFAVAKGSATDRHGFTLYKLTSSELSIPQKEEDGFDFFGGVDIDLINFSYSRDWKHDDFYSSTLAQAPLEISVLPVDFSFREKFIKLGIGFSAGAGIQMFNVDEVYSISIGHKEKDEFMKYFDKMDEEVMPEDSLYGFGVSVSEKNRGQGTLMFLGRSTGIPLFRINSKRDAWETLSYHQSKLDAYNKKFGKK